MKTRTILLIVFAAFSTVAPGSKLSAQRAQSQNPHGTLPAGLDCVNCHIPEAWTPLKSPILFDHNRATRFPLDGRHANATCTSCHLNDHFDEPRATLDDCGSCHVDVHLGNLSGNCLSCHNTVSFTDVQGLDVHAGTQFPLLGAHMQVSCESCHGNDRGGAFATLDTDCISCHQADYQGAQSINHIDAGFPETCDECHNTIAWSGGTVFNHVTASGGYPLIGAHEIVSCRGCHIMPGAALINTPANENDCIACHQTEYQSEHGGSSFPTTCLECHTQDTWGDATFDHNTATNFPLVGAHVRANCNDCHTQPGNQLIFTPANTEDCVACHQADYQREHAGSGFPTQCLNCHTVNNWDASFDHNTATNFDLLGAHTQAPCAACHTQPGNQLIFTPTNQDDCVACHRTDYDNTHTGSGFPETCVTCHNPSDWLNVTFQDHDAQYFPIFSGRHRGEWNNDCATCHTVPNNFTSFTCLNCHAHRKTEMDDKHQGRNGYVYESTACLSCHPNGRSG